MLQMTDKLDLRVGDVVLVKLKVALASKGCFPAVQCLQGGNILTVDPDDIESIISRAETDAEKIARLEAELAKAPRRIKWSGGQCPVDPDSKVLVYLASNIIDCGKAKYFTWGSLQDHDNIIAYMVLPQ